MNKDIKYLAFFDLLGTQNFSGNAKDYFYKINRLQERIQDNSAYLGLNNNIFNISFFSDSCYVESKNLFELLLYMKMLRDDLSATALFFNAAIIKVSNDQLSESFRNICAEYKNNCKICGTTFLDNSVATAFVEQNRFKGIGIYLSPEVAVDAESDEKLKGEIISSIYLSDHKKYDSLTIYKDLVFSPISDKLEARWITEIIKSYFLACSDNERHGKYYVSLLTNIINCASNDIEWDTNSKRFGSSNTVFNAMMSIFMSKEKHCFLTGIDVLAIVFINKILSSCLLPQEKIDIIQSLFNVDCVANKYLTNLDSVPWLAFFGNKNNEETFKTYCHQYIVNTKITDI